MGKELLFKALKNQETDRVPWVPFNGVHGGALIGVTADEYLKSAELIVKGTNEAIKRYRPDGIPVGFDLQVEAEALGCDIVWASDNPPAVSSHPLETGTYDDLPEFTKKSARVPILLDAVKQLRAEHDDIAIYGLVTGPFTLALHLRGTQIFMDMFDDSEKVKTLMEYSAGIATKMSQMYVEAGCDVIALVDPMTSQISPEAFHEFVTPYATQVFDSIRQTGALSSFFVCGHAQRNVEEMCLTKPDNISIDENIDLQFVKDVCGKHGVSFGGNLQLTVVLLMGDEQDCQKNAIECLEIGGKKGFILAPGCDLPYAVPPNNLEAITELVHDPYKQEIARELLGKESSIKVDLDFNDYGLSDKVTIDIITLDSEGCAPCQYMVEAVKRVITNFGDLVVWREHKIKERESVEFMMGMMVKNIPTILIDGQIKFVSLIPSREELTAAIQARINEKFQSMLNAQKNRMIVIDPGTEEATQLIENIEKAQKELGTNVEISVLKEKNEISSYGFSKTSAVIVERRQVKAVDRTPSVEVIKEWLKEM